MKSIAWVRGPLSAALLASSRNRICRAASAPTTACSDSRTNRTVRRSDAQSLAGRHRRDARENPRVERSGTLPSVPDTPPTPPAASGNGAPPSGNGDQPTLAALLKQQEILSADFSEEGERKYAEIVKRIAELSPKEQQQWPMTPAAPPPVDPWSMSSQASHCRTRCDAYSLAPATERSPAGCSGREACSWTCSRAMPRGPRVCSREMSKHENSSTSSWPRPPLVMPLAMRCWDHRTGDPSG